MANMIPISTVTVGSGGAASIDFTGIPQTYTDLIIRTSLRNESNTQDTVLRPNNQSTNLTYRYLIGNGSNPASYTDTAIYGVAGRSTYTASTFSNGEWYVPNYASTTVAKSFSLSDLNENNSTTALIEMGAGLWNSTNPITSIVLAPFGGGNFVQYSSATLYGIRKY